MRSSTTSGGTVTAPMPARGIGIDASTRQRAARPTRRPDAGELAAGGHHDHPGPGLGRGGGGLDRLLGVARERDGEHERVGPDERRALVALGHDDRHGQVGPATAAATSPPMPLPPMPRIDAPTLIPSGRGRSGSAAAAAAAAICSGSAEGRVEHAEGVEHAASQASNVGSMPVGLGLGQQPVVLGVVDRLGLVDQHDGDAVADRRSAACRRGL